MPPICSGKLFLDSAYGFIGGDDTFIDGDYTYHSFTTPGTVIVNVLSNVSIDYLVVAGGGSGGYYHGGGGGGGEILNASTSLTPGSLSITVGAGGIATQAAPVGFYGTQGGSSSIGSLVVTEGGGCGGQGYNESGSSWGSGQNAGEGACGGGGGGTNILRTGAAGTYANGGNSNSVNPHGGGGGGGMSPQNGGTTTVVNKGGNGGNGKSVEFVPGSPVIYSGGGYGAGGVTNGTPGSGSTNPGGGGSGGGPTLYGSNGQNGIIYIRYLTRN